MDIQDRIAQWENMTQADPDNAMGWMSLGNAYKDADRPEDAAAALGKAVELDPSLSRASQVLGQVLIQLGREDEAGELLEKAYVTAAEQGDVMPQRAMGSLLEKIGRPIPEVAAAQDQAPVATGDQIIDRKTGKLGSRMPDPPMRGPMGKFIYDHFSQETWREWIAMGTKVINEFRLDFSRDDHQKIYDDQMMEWLGISQEDVDAYAREQPGADQPKT